MSLVLVVLAAGVGSRYGGPKQIDPVGPGGATLLDYAAYDAHRAGFERAVLVVREGMEQRVREAAGQRIARRLPLAYVVQDRALPPGFVNPPGRTKPWGTGHAALAAAAQVDGPFAVINADDFYGSSTYRILADYLRSRPPRDETPEDSVPEYAMVGFPLLTTLSPDGPVSRGVCTVDGSGHLVAIEEVLRLEKDDGDARAPGEDGRWRRIPGATPVSLNFWGFFPSFLPALREGFERFLLRHGGSASEEYFLLYAVQDLIAAGRARVRVLTGGGPWSGLTHPGDRGRLVSLLRELTERGDYPRDLGA